MKRRGVGTTTADKNVEEWETFYTAGGNVKWCSQCGKVCQFLKMLNIELSYDPGIPLLSICPSLTKTCKQMFSVIINNSQKWKQSKCSTDEQVNKICYIQIREFYSAEKKKKNDVLRLQHIWTLKYYTKWEKLGTKNPTYFMISFI